MTKKKTYPQVLEKARFPIAYVEPNTVTKIKTKIEAPTGGIAGLMTGAASS
jgi:hypothetical protein